MGSRQRPPGRTKGGGQARADESGADRRAEVADQRRQEEETLADAREDVEEPLPSEELADRARGDL